VYFNWIRKTSRSGWVKKGLPLIGSLRWRACVFLAVSKDVYSYLSGFPLNAWAGGSGVGTNDGLWSWAFEPDKARRLY